jgi:hypothetical protein
LQNKKIKEYVKARDEMLMKCSVAELRKFIAEHEQCFSLMFVDAIARASDEILEMTLHKMIVNCTSLPFDFRQKSADWLLDKSLNLEL